MSDNEIPKLEIVKLVEIKCTVKSNLIHGIGYPHYKVEDVKARDLALAQELPECCGTCTEIVVRTMKPIPANYKWHCFKSCPVRLVKEALNQ